VYGDVPPQPVWWQGDNYAPGWVAPQPRTSYIQYSTGYWGNDVQPPWVNVPPLIIPAPVTVPLPQWAPQVGCVNVPYTFQSPAPQTATYTDTITQPPLDSQITVYVDQANGQTSTDWGPLQTVYEVIVYTTTALVDVVSATQQCG